MRTMLPPNLTRHYYETRRLMAEGGGNETIPWYRLTSEQKETVEWDVEILRRAILRAEEEQDLVANFNGSTPEKPQAAADTTTAADDCSCPGCSAVAAVIELIRQGYARVEGSTPDARRATRGPVLFAGIPVDVRPDPLSSEESAYLEKAAREAVESWVAAGKPLEATTGPAGGVVGTFEFTQLSVETLDALMGFPEHRFAFDARRWDSQARLYPMGRRV